MYIIYALNMECIAVKECKKNTSTKHHNKIQSFAKQTKRLALLPLFKCKFTEGNLKVS